MTKITSLLVVLILVPACLFSQNTEIKKSEQDMSYLKKENKSTPPLFNDINTGFFQDLETALKHTSNVKHLNLQNSNLNEVSLVISNFKNLEILDVSHNKIENISTDFIRSFPKLQSLYLNNNLIKDERVEELKTQLPSIKIFSNSDFNK